MKMKVIACEVNTGGGSMVTIIKCDLWDYCLVTNDESVAVYTQEDHFWEGEDPIEFTLVKSGE
jgi:hypothetical protein